MWLSLRQTSLLDGHLVPVPKVSVLERVTTNFKWIKTSIVILTSIPLTNNSINYNKKQQKQSKGLKERT